MNLEPVHREVRYDRRRAVDGKAFPALNYHAWKQVRNAVLAEQRIWIEIGRFVWTQLWIGGDEPAGR